ncbi:MULTISPECIES: hypothetical protein [Vibrio]|nr:MULTISPECIES: hypothetical protein [Vibrio]WFB51008.1 hypothetical protein P6988_26000 [Vibrio coralliilyticus]
MIRHAEWGARPSRRVKWVDPSSWGLAIIGGGQTHARIDKKRCWRLRSAQGDGHWLFKLITDPVSLGLLPLG